MPSLSQQKATAIAEVERYAQFDLPPTVDRTLYIGEDVFDRYRRATIWTASTAYNYGDVILPTVRNGHRYRCTRAGISGATEPTWVLGVGYSLTEGASNPLLRWTEDGADYANVYDARLCLHEIWSAKTAAAASLYQLRMGGNYDHAQQQIYEHCRQMADRYAPLLVS